MPTTWTPLRLPVDGKLVDPAPHGFDVGTVIAHENQDQCPAIAKIAEPAKNAVRALELEPRSHASQLALRRIGERHQSSKLEERPASTWSTCPVIFRE
jgi:hypothetical protein